MAGKAGRGLRYRKCAEVLIRARQSRDPKEVKEAFSYLIGVSKQFLTVDEAASLTSFWFSQIDNQPWLVDIIEEPYKESGKYKVQDLDQEETAILKPPQPQKLKFKNRIK